MRSVNLSIQCSCDLGLCLVCKKGGGSTVHTGMLNHKGETEGEKE